MDISLIYPYLVTMGYPRSEAGYEQEIGNGIRITLVVDINEMVSNLTTGDVQSLGLSWDELLSRAIENLDRLAINKKIGIQLFESGPAGQPFILVGGHWAAAALMVSPKFNAVAAEALQTENVCASIPHREALIAFPKGESSSRDAMRAMIRENEADGAKPLTWELFELTEFGPVPLEE